MNSLQKNELIRISRNLIKTGTVLQSAHMNIRYACCATPDHPVQAFCPGELCSTRVSIKLLPHYTCLENMLVEGKARNKHRPVNERKSSYIFRIHVYRNLWVVVWVGLLCVTKLHVYKHRIAL